MAPLTQFALATGLVGLVAGQSASVTQIFFPWADEQQFDASVIGQDGDVKTIVMECAPGTDGSDCGFPEPITLTAGPSTLRLNPTGIYQMMGLMDCKVTGSTEADCTAITGLYTDTALPTGTYTDYPYITTPAESSVTDSAILTGTDISWMDVTITAGLVSGSNSVAASTSTSRGSSSSAATGSSSRTSGSSTGSSASSTADAASTSGNAAAGSSRFAYTGLAAALVAGSMMMM